MDTLLIGAALAVVLSIAWLAWLAWLAWRRRWPQVPEMAPAHARADAIEVFKKARRLELKRDGIVLKKYRIALGFAPDGHKEREGDGRTPEGDYSIDGRNPRSAFHLSLRVSYPDDHARQKAAAAGVAPGGEIFVHGQPNAAPSRADHPDRDWTTGCIAVTNEEMREIWSLVPTGTRITIHR